MKNLLAASIIILITVSSACSQDIVWLKDGQKLNCRVLKQDSSFLYFEMRINGLLKKTFVDNNSVDSLTINYQINSSGRFEKSTIGFGIGLDHGGFGGNLVLYPARNLGIFGGIGYAFAGIGYNAGLKIKLVGKNHKSSVYPYLLGMYGYNAAIAILNAKQYSKFFYGPSFGLGFDIRSKPEKRGFITMALLVPVRKNDVQDYVDRMKRNGVEFSNELYPVGFSIGYHIIMN